MAKLNFQQFFCVFFVINLSQAFSSSHFTSLIENQNTDSLRSSKSYYEEIKLFESSERFCEFVHEEDKLATHSSQDSSQNFFLPCHVDNFLDISNTSSPPKKSFECVENTFEISMQKKSLEDREKLSPQRVSKKRRVLETSQDNFNQSIQITKHSLSIKSNSKSSKRSGSDLEESSIELPLKKKQFLKISQNNLNQSIQIVEDSFSMKSNFKSLKRSWSELEKSFVNPPLKKRRCLESSQHMLNNEGLVKRFFTQSSSQGILTPPLIESLKQITDDYNVFLIDVVGVIHNGREAFKPSIQVINNLIKTKKVALISNTPRPHQHLAETLHKMGLDPQVPIYTAGDMVRDDLLNIYKDQKVYHLGAQRNQDILRDLEIQTISTLEHASVVLLTQYIEENESLDEFDSILKEIAARKLTVLCANSDKTATVGDRLRYCAGTLAQKIEDFGGEVQYYGKPNTKIFDLVINKITDTESISKSRILIIGDTLEKDIKGACNCEIDSLLVLTGTTGQDLKKMEQETKVALKKRCFHQKIKPTYYINSIK